MSQNVVVVPSGAGVIDPAVTLRIVVRHILAATTRRTCLRTATVSRAIPIPTSPRPRRVRFVSDHNILPAAHQRLHQTEEFAADDSGVELWTNGERSAPIRDLIVALVPAHATDRVIHQKILAVIEGHGDRVICWSSGGGEDVFQLDFPWRRATEKLEGSCSDNKRRSVDPSAVVAAGGQCRSGP